MVTHVSPIVHCDPGLTNASMRYVFMKIDGDLGSNQQPVAIPDDGEIITVRACGRAGVLAGVAARPIA